MRRALNDSELRAVIADYIRRNDVPASMARAVSSSIVYAHWKMESDCMYEPRAQEAGARRAQSERSVQDSSTPSTPDPSSTSS
jgi:crotonobetainyl-CoA:carnitine CoA-transferase CaiB-like acyl-CoA transferase